MASCEKISSLRARHHASTWITSYHSHFGGPDHALNLVLMKDRRNHYFGADLTAEKAQEVGPQTMLAAHEFYVHFYRRKAALGPGVHQALLQQLQPFGSLRARAVPLLAGSMKSSW